MCNSETSHKTALGTDARGNLTRIENALAQMPQRLTSVQARLVQLDMELNIDGRGRSQPQQTIAKSARPSVLSKLKVPPVHGTPNRIPTGSGCWPSPLGDVFKEFESRETDTWMWFFDSMESRANAVIAAEAEQRRIPKETPVYPYSGICARENGELEQYLAFHKANVACKKAIETAIREHYHDNCLGSKAALEVIDAFGMDRTRTLYVLAATIREKDWDGRISRSNKDWARTIPVFKNLDDWGHDRNIEFVVDACNPGLNDRKGHFVLISKDEDRSQPLKKLRKPARKNLQKTPVSPKKKTAKRQEPER